MTKTCANCGNGKPTITAPYKIACCQCQQMKIVEPDDTCLYWRARADDH